MWSSLMQKRYFPSQLTAGAATKQDPLTFSPVLVKFSPCKAQQEMQ